MSRRKKEFWRSGYQAGDYLSPAFQMLILLYSDEGYMTTSLKIIYHKVEADHSTAGSEDDGQLKCLGCCHGIKKEAAKEKHDSIQCVVSTSRNIKKQSDEHLFLA